MDFEHKTVPSFRRYFSQRRHLAEFENRENKNFQNFEGFIWIHTHIFHSSFSSMPVNPFVKLSGLNRFT